jgi:hypothetical protein
MVPAPGRDRVGSSRVYLTNTTRGWMITPCYDKDQQLTTTCTDYPGIFDCDYLMCA